MRYEIELPDDLDQQLAERASATGENVPELIRVAVRQFVYAGIHLPHRERRPDPLSEASEIPPPIDLPRGLRDTPHLVQPEKHSHRRPDPLIEDE